MKFITRVLVRGLGIAIPIGLTIYILYYLVFLAEKWLSPLVAWVLGENYYVTGMGVLTGLLLIFLVGLGTYSKAFRDTADKVGDFLGRVPLVKTLYGGLMDLMDFVRQSNDHEKGLSHVVKVDIHEDWSLIGFVTRESFEQLPDNLASGDERVAVYLPMSYQIGGFTVYLPASQITRLDISVEDAMRLSLTAAMSIGSKDGNGSKTRLTEYLDAAETSDARDRRAASK
ncbi:MAG: DUF502 domain-containing protein [Planctomycetota bacterium]